MGISLHGANTDRVKKIIEVVSQLHGPTLISKGPVDVISDAKSTVVCGTSAGWWIRQGAKHTISGQKVAGGMNGSWLQPIKLLWCPAAGARRCGSQGDILSGVMSVFVSWTRSFMAEAAKSGELVLPELNHMVLAAFGACNVTRQVHQAPVCDSLGLMLSSQDCLLGTICVQSVHSCAPSPVQDGMCVRFCCQAPLHAGIGRSGAAGPCRGNAGEQRREQRDHWAGSASQVASLALVSGQAGAKL